MIHASFGTIGFSNRVKDQSMKRILRDLAKRGYGLYQSTIDRRFFALARDAGGMMAPAIYKKIYDCVYDAPDLDIVEVGGASGAGSIAAAWAMRDSGKKSKLVVIEKCEGGSRSRYGSYDDNLSRITNNFERFGADETIRLYPHELSFKTGEEVLRMIETPRIAALILDADGRLDRDFFLFWPRLIPGGLIIVDDYADEAKYQPISEDHPQGGVKKRLTYRLLNRMRDWGLFQPRFKIRQTIFGFKPADADFARLDLDDCRRVVNGLDDERAKAIGQSRSIHTGGWSGSTPPRSLLGP
jgi:predicted O-methyltransferase YrrM